MVRNTAGEGSDGCAAGVLERRIMDPREERMGRASLSFWLRREVSREGNAGTDPYPTFEAGGFRFTVRTRDLRLIGDLEAFAREIAGHPRADRKFTFRLLGCTEEGRLGGWAWQKERAEVGYGGIAEHAG